MEREELINFLRENLIINVSTDRGNDYGQEHINVQVSISLPNRNDQMEIISRDNDIIYL